MQELIGVHDVAQLLGVSERMIYQLVARCRIPHLRVGRLLRFPVEDLAAWLKDSARRCGDHHHRRHAEGDAP